MTKIIPRAEARRHQLKHYFTGRPCKRGHVTVRFTGNKRCRECERARAKTYYTDNPEKIRTYRRLKKRGVDQATYDKMVRECGDRCTICRSEMASGRGTWHVDHCHASGKVRGLLCHHCNTALGLVRDSVPVLKSMIEYLGRNSDQPAWASVPPPKEESK